MLVELNVQEVDAVSGGLNSVEAGYYAGAIAGAIQGARIGVTYGVYGGVFGGLVGVGIGGGLGAIGGVAFHYFFGGSRNSNLPA